MSHKWRHWREKTLKVNRFQVNEAFIPYLSSSLDMALSAIARCHQGPTSATNNPITTINKSSSKQHSRCFICGSRIGRGNQPSFLNIEERMDKLISVSQTVEHSSTIISDILSRILNETVSRVQAMKGDQKHVKTFF